MATLTDDVKAFIVQALACFDTPSQVVDAVREGFGTEVSRMQVQSYDPTKKAAYCPIFCSERWEDAINQKATGLHIAAERGFNKPLENVG